MSDGSPPTDGAFVKPWLTRTCAITSGSVASATKSVVVQASRTSPGWSVNESFGAGSDVFTVVGAATPMNRRRSGST